MELALYVSIAPISVRILPPTNDSAGYSGLPNVRINTHFFWLYCLENIFAFLEGHRTLRFVYVSHVCQTRYSKCINLIKKNLYRLSKYISKKIWAICQFQVKAAQRIAISVQNRFAVVPDLWYHTDSVNLFSWVDHGQVGSMLAAAVSREYVYDSYTASFVALSSSLDPSLSFYCYLFSLFQLSFCYKGYCEFFCVGYCLQAFYLAIHSSHIDDCYGCLFIFPNSLSSLFLTFGVLFLMCCGAFLGFYAMVIVCHL